MKRIRLLSLVLLVVLLTGCLSPRIDVAIKPNPIIVTAGMGETEEISLVFKMKGFSLGYTLKEVLVTLMDEEGDEKVTKTFDLENKKIPVLPGVGHTQAIGSIPLDEISDLNSEQYDEVLKGKEWRLEIVVVGTKNSEATATVKFE